MTGTFSKIYLQIIFSVKGRRNLLLKPWREEVFKLMSDIIDNRNQKAIIVNGVSDHVHILLGAKPNISVPYLERDIKTESTKFINDKRYLNVPFAWQEGYGVFSYSNSQIPMVYKYILEQEKHHNEKTFEVEYKDFLKKFEIEYNEKFLFG